MTTGLVLGARAVFLLWFCTTVPRSVIGLKISRHFLNQSEVKPKPIATSLHTFSRALCRLHVFASSFDWFTGSPVSSVIGQSDYFSFPVLIVPE